MKAHSKVIAGSLLSIVVGLALGLALISFTGESPLKVLSILAKSSFNSAYDFGMTLFYSTPLILSGLSVATAYRSGLFNIGGEGQLVMGALGAALGGIYFPQLPSLLAPLFGCFLAMLFGAFWGFIPAYLKVKRGSHEVITTIMLNFIAAALTSYFILYVIKNPASQSPESLPVAAQYSLAHFAFFEGAPVSVFTIFAVLLASGIYYLFEKTPLGFEMKCSGKSLAASEAAGINSKTLQLVSFSLAGGIAGLIGAAEVLSNAGKFKMDFSPGYGFTGIAVCLLARAHPIGIVFSALLFGALHKGSMDLDMETEKVTREVTMILQGLIILAVASQEYFAKYFHRAKEQAK